jgi:hypothetical protein
MLKLRVKLEKSEEARRGMRGIWGRKEGAANNATVVA